MLVLYQLLYVLLTLRGIFMHFLELTYLQDAEVPVPVFYYFLYFRKVIQEIFSELDETKPEVPISPSRTRRPKENQRWAREQPHHGVAWPNPWPRHHVVWAP
jgi:hypothetical protein